jgi:hypothetical protein
MTSPATSPVASTATGGAVPASSARQLFAALDDALAAETSVRQDIGNLNPPPTTTLVQEYGGGRDALAFVVDLGHGTEPLRVYRVGGLVYVGGQAPVRMSDVGPRDTTPVAQVLHSDVREDFRRMAAAAGDLAFVGEEVVDGTSASHYRFSLRLAPGANPASLPALLRGPRPADLWVTSDGLPARLQVAYSAPLRGVPGTGVVRVDYSGWSEPLDLDPAQLDRTGDALTRPTS